MEKITLVLGVSLNPERYSNKAIHALVVDNQCVVAFGLRVGNIGNIEVHDKLPQKISIDTVTLYLNPGKQKEYYNYLVDLKPRRVIFNPGTENFELISILEQEGIITEIACTLVLLSIGNY
jgi:predicted CoA-binding protein|tara:strand:- start:219 stop:581 length:363 start_codon:yes stop_codon:yes gene_type:complete